MSYTDIDQVCNYIQTRITENKVALGLNNVSFAMDTGMPLGYPHVAVIAGELTRTPEASGRQVELHFSVLIYVIHAELGVTRAARTHADLQNAAAVRNLLHSNNDPNGHNNYTMDGNIAGGWIASERPRVLPFPQAKQVIGTELMWTGRGRGLIF